MVAMPAATAAEEDVEVMAFKSPELGIRIIIQITKRSSDQCLRRVTLIDCTYPDTPGLVAFVNLHLVVTG